jgi:hypothetical protein
MGRGGVPSGLSLFLCLELGRLHCSLGRLFGNQQQVTRNFELEKSCSFQIDDKLVSVDCWTGSAAIPGVSGSPLEQTFDQRPRL